MATTFAPASSNADELPFLAAITASFASPDAYHVYADWLEERGDPRAAYLRALVAARFGGKALSGLPVLAPEHDVWTNAVGGKLLASIQELKLSEHVEAICRWTRPIIGIQTTRIDEAQLPLGASKFGGHPDVPAGFEWPVCDRGPLGFLGQISFAEIRNSQATQRYGLPTAGSLLLFAYQDYDEGIQPGVVEEVDGKYRQIPGLTCIIKTPDEPLRRLEPTVELNEANGIMRCCALTMADGLDVPNPKDTEDSALIQANEKWKVSDLRRKVNSFEHWLMGYPVHGRTDNTSPGKDWTGLMTLGSDDKLGWSWCDGEHLDLYVHLDSVRDGQFEKTYGYAS